MLPWRWECERCDLLSELTSEMQGSLQRFVPPAATAFGTIRYHVISMVGQLRRQVFVGQRPGC